MPQKVILNEFFVFYMENRTIGYLRIWIILVYSVALKKTLYNNDNALEKVVNFRHLEEDMCRSFERWTTRKWREGNNKTSFNYLLLDPRVSLNLPKRAHEISRLDTWKCFLSSIFYIGKGKRSRPYAHLYKAVAFWQKKRADCSDDKVGAFTCAFGSGSSEKIKMCHDFSDSTNR